MFNRRQSEPVKDVWGPHFNERRVPVEADSVELDRLVLRLNALVELRGEVKDLERTTDILAHIEAEIAYAMQSPTKHRDWREARPRVLQLLTELGQVLYQELPEPADEER